MEGSVAGSRRYRAFIPADLPPNPPLDLGALYGAIDQATLELARLDGFSRLLPDTHLILYQYVRKEALLSSQIEGTQSSLSDLLLFENDELPGVPLADVQEVSNYVAALNSGLNAIRTGRPISQGLLNELHQILLASGRGSQKAPGMLRTTQNWLGGSNPANATFVPPPPLQVPNLMADLMAFIHDEDVRLPILVHAALVHAQFETIHPYLDGNGRLGRLLTTLLLCAQGTLGEPLLYLSLFFKAHRADYYERLMRVRTHGEWEQWADFFLHGVTETAQQASAAAKAIAALFEGDRDMIRSLGRAAPSALRVHEYLQQRLLVSVPQARKALGGMSAPTIRRAIEHLEALGIVRETTGKARDRSYLYGQYLRILEAGTEPIRPA